jgi:hypothetical protein
MAINGNPKFFETSVIGSGGIVPTTNTDTADLARIPNNFAAWSGSQNEVITINFTSQIVDRIIIANHNIENYTIKYDLNGVLTDFDTPIVETSYSNNTSYYEITPVTTNKIVITCTNNSVNISIAFLAVTREIGTLASPVQVSKENFDRAIKKRKGFDNRILPFYDLPRYDITIRFRQHGEPDTVQNDYDIYNNLSSRISSFLVWLCGGNDKGFYVQRVGWRLQDFYQMIAVSNQAVTHTNGYYGLCFNASLKLSEYTQ